MGKEKKGQESNNPADCTGKTEYPVLCIETGHDADGGACQGRGGAAGDHRQAEGEGTAKMLVGSEAVGNKNLN